MLSNFLLKNGAISAVKKQSLLRSKSSGVIGRVGMQRYYNGAFRASQHLNKPYQSDNFVNGTSAVFVDNLYEQWQEDPTSVHSSWQAYFSNVDGGAAEPFQAPPTLGQTKAAEGSVKIADIMAALQSGGTAEAISIDAQSVESAQIEAFRLMQLIRFYMSHGHYGADLDPLGLKNLIQNVAQSQYSHTTNEQLQQLDPAFYGFTEKDLDRSFYVDVPQLGGILAKKKTWKLGEIIDALKNAYCQKIGIEYMHIADFKQKKYLRDLFELR